MKIHKSPVSESTPAPVQQARSLNQVFDHRSTASAQLQRQILSNNSPQATQLKKHLENLNQPVQRVEDEEPMQGKLNTAQRALEEESMQGKFETTQRVEEEEPVQGKFETAQRVEEERLIQGKFDIAQRVEDEEPVQGKFSEASITQRQEASANNTGLPDQLKSGIESLSGMSMDHVNVHYNSAQPAQLNAHAYAQGSEIHVAPGQEQHLPHEAWHIVQQAQGRVKPTMQMKMGVPVNDDAGLETEADVMGERALGLGAVQMNTEGKVEKSEPSPQSESTTQRKQQETINNSVSVNATNSNAIQRKPEDGEKHNSSISEIINSLKVLQEQDDVKADPEAMQEIAQAIEKASEVLKGDDAQAKEALVESANTGTISSVDEEKARGADSTAQMKAFDSSAPVQRVIGLVIVAATVGYGIYRIWQNHRRVATPAPGAGEIQDIPTTRAEFGETLSMGGLTTRERTNQEIGAEVRARTGHNHDVLYQQLIEDGAVNDIAHLINGIRDDDGLCIGTLCHDLTRFLIERRTRVRPTIEALRAITGAGVIAYDLNGGQPLEDILRGSPAGTSVFLGSAEAMSGHTFTVVGENRGRVIVADRQPANPIAALKYASAVEAEARLSRSLNPGDQAAIDREFSGGLILNQIGL